MSTCSCCQQRRRRRRRRWSWHNTEHKARKGVSTTTSAACWVLFVSGASALISIPPYNTEAQRFPVLFMRDLLRFAFHRYLDYLMSHVSCLMSRVSHLASHACHVSRMSCDVLVLENNKTAAMLSLRGGKSLGAAFPALSQPEAEDGRVGGRESI